MRLTTVQRVTEDSVYIVYDRRSTRSASEIFVRGPRRVRSWVR